MQIHLYSHLNLAHLVLINSVSCQQLQQQCINTCCMVSSSFGLMSALTAWTSTVRMPLYLLMLPNANVVVVHAFNCICPALLLQEDKLISTKQSQPCACFVLQAVKQQQQRSPIFAIVRTSFCSRGTCPQITASWLQLDVTAKAMHKPLPLVGDHS